MPVTCPAHNTHLDYNIPVIFDEKYELSLP
jgi:hypothetical protein